MMYEALRYFAGKTARERSSTTTAGSATDSHRAAEPSKVASWTNPYGGTKPFCAKPFLTVMSDVNLSYDSDQLPGRSFRDLSPPMI